jgi:hypothetical protein
MWLSEDSRLRLQILTDDINLPCIDGDSLEIYNGVISNTTSIAYPDKNSRVRITRFFGGAV